MGRWQRGTIAGLILLAVPAEALADKQIEAASSNRYTTTAVTIDQGERLTFVNNDLSNHDVLSEKVGADGFPLFKSELIGVGKSSFVEGSQYLTTGSYGFLCSIHSFMTGTLTVTSAGTPVPRPGAPPPPQPGDKTAPALKLNAKATTLANARRAKRLAISVMLDEAATVSLRASARVGGRTLTLGTRSISLPAGRKTVSLKLTSAAVTALRGRGSVRVTVRGTAKDGSGNKRTVSAARTLR